MDAVYYRQLLYCVREERQLTKDETHFIDHHSHYWFHNNVAQTQFHMSPHHEEATRHAVRTDFLHLLTGV